LSIKSFVTGYAVSAVATIDLRYCGSVIEYLRWGLALVPAALFGAFLYDFRRVIKRKREEAEDLIKYDGARVLYVRQYASVSKQPRALVLFDETYGGVSNIFPVIALLLVMTGWAFAALYTLFCDHQFIPTSGAFAVAGAFTYAVIALGRLRRLEDLAPRNVHAVWIHILIAPLIASVAGSSLSKIQPFDALTGFSIGLVPLRTLIEWVTTRTRTVLGIGNDTVPAEAPNLQYLQGASQDVVTRLADEGFTSVSHVAYADPVRIMLVTGLERKLLIDLMDQALLYVYLGDSIQNLRSAGVRGAIEVRELFHLLTEGNAEEKQHAAATLASIAKALERDEGAVWNLAQTIHIDAQAELLNRLWATTFDADGNAAADEKRMLAPPAVTDAATTLARALSASAPPAPAPPSKRPSAEQS
jgi:hypothetical protein